jgi:hypothetical protein
MAIDQIAQSGLISSEVSTIRRGYLASSQVLSRGLALRGSLAIPDEPLKLCVYPFTSILSFRQPVIIPQPELLQLNIQNVYKFIEFLSQLSE